MIYRTPVKSDLKHAVAGEQMTVTLYQVVR
jgi:hypothetical protein